MSLRMANGDEARTSAWPVQDGGDVSSVSHDRKMSGIEPLQLFLDYDQQQQQGQQQQQQHSWFSIEGTESIVIGDPDADRPLPANFLSSGLFSRGDTTTASLLFSPHHLHHHASPNDDEAQTQPFSNNNNNSDHTFIDPNLSTVFSSLQLHQQPFVQSIQTFVPGGIREASWDTRLASVTPNNDTTNQQAQNQLHNNALSSMFVSTTPQQNNLSNTRNILVLEAPPPPQLSASTIGEQHSSFSMGIGQNLDVTNSSWTPFEENKMRSATATPEGKTRDGDDSTVQSTAVLSTATHEEPDDMLSPASMMSPASSPRVVPASGQVHDSEGGPNAAIIGTPSTVSTAPSTEDCSLGTDSIEKIGLKLDPTHIEPFTLHRRAPSWDRSPLSRNLYTDTEISASTAPREVMHSHPPQPYWAPLQHQQPTLTGRAQAAYPPHLQQQQQHAASASAWTSPHTTQSRVASFRNEEVIQHDSRSAIHHPYAHIAARQHHTQQQQLQQVVEQRWQQTPRHFGVTGDLSQLQGYSGQQQGRPVVHAEGLTHHTGFRGNQGFNPYSVQRKPGYPPQHPLPSSQQSPQRPARGLGPRQGPSPHRGGQQLGGPPSAAGVSASGSSRSSSEILKTLLRKKACLYEPDTSRAVALVTWLVGRELALEFGYFSRQQLQAGVHACVAEKIESGTITRTKVNRCMQIILNSCFHYIIPRPDGTEEKGHAFRAMFEQEVSDDVYLLRMLPAPWNDLIVSRDVVLRASAAELDGKFELPQSNYSSPKGSPSLRPVDPLSSIPRSPIREHGDDDGLDSKRAVLLCFNENVRAAEDVFRCHNEFIRDSAHSSNLQLTAHEWRIFFGKEAASTPHIWGNIGIPVVAVESGDGSGRKLDVLGLMTPSEAGKFRTTWCAKRYDHDHEFCGMAHVEVNGGWLRRDPNVHRYKDELCPAVVNTADNRVGAKFFVINSCHRGVNCEFAHSQEELIYHPNRYKSKSCPSIMRSGTCRLGDICPHHHPSDSVRSTGKKEGGRPPGPRVGRAMGPTPGGGKGHIGLPAGSPILYASPAPVSSFERHLLMPGLQNLFRRQCTVVRAHLRNPMCRCCYSHFGDDSGIDAESPSVTRPNNTTWPGLPPSSARM